MNKIEVISLVGQNGKSFGKYVDYGDFCKMQSEYEKQIEKMKDYGNCKYGYYGNMCTRDDTKCCEGCKDWELAE